MFISSDRKFMEAAIEEMKKCHNIPHKPKVGAIIVINDEIVATGYKGQTDKNSHAEIVAIQNAISKCDGISIKGATLYSTMEPCFETNAKCSETIVENGFSEVVFGSFDINPKIKQRGYNYLKSKGVKLRGFDQDLNQLIDQINEEFINNFQRSVGPQNQCHFPYKQNQNESTLELIFSSSDSRSIKIKCSSRDDNSVYLYTIQPALIARSNEYCDFEKLDNSLLHFYDFDHHAEISENEIAVLKSSDGFILVKISKINRDNPVVHVKFEIRNFPINS